MASNPQAVEAREASASDPNGKRNHVSAKTEARPEHQSVHAHAAPLPLLTDHEKGYRLGCRDTNNATRIVVALELERRGEDLARLASAQEMGAILRAVNEAMAVELFAQAARIRAAVTL